VRTMVVTRGIRRASRLKSATATIAARQEVNSSVR
jgi:hypothetical protein